MLKTVLYVKKHSGFKKCRYHIDYLHMHRTAGTSTRILVPLKSPTVVSLRQNSELRKRMPFPVYSFTWTPEIAVVSAPATVVTVVWSCCCDGNPTTVVLLWQQQWLLGAYQYLYWETLLLMCSAGCGDGKVAVVMPPAAIVTSVADSVCFTGFRILDPTFFHPGSRILIFSSPDPDPGSA
jgi:hypothetical protein